MAQQVVIAGALFNDVPSISVPDSNNVYHPFVDTSDANASAGDIASGKTAYVNGTKLTGTGSGGSPVINSLSVTQNGTYTASGGVDGYSPVTVNVSGGGGLVYESGTFIPSEKTNKPTINFLSSHSTLPFYVVIYDVTSTVSSYQNSIAYWAIMNHYGAYGGLEFSNGTIWYARTQGGYINVSTPTVGGSNITSLVDNTSTGLPYFLTTTGFSPWINNSRYFYTDRTYKWIAVWAPTV